MINANELRIGNRLNHNNGYIVGMFKVELVHICDIIENNEFSKQYEFVPLTEEILLKCGFKYREAMAGGQDEWAGYGFWSLNDIHLLGHKNSGKLYFNRNDKTQYLYLHQLQNLYFALTNKELEINL